MIDSLSTNTGRSLKEWFVVLSATGLDKHTDLMNTLKQEHGLSHGFANSIVLLFRARDTDQGDDALVAAQYTGPKATLRPTYDALVAAVSGFGPDVEIAPKKATVSLRRSKQFALIEPGSKRLQLVINLKGTPPAERMREA